jgi:hypothetical protein
VIRREEARNNSHRPAHCNLFRDRRSWSTATEEKRSRRFRLRDVDAVEPLERQAAGLRAVGGEVRYAVTKYIASGIPISVFVFDSPWEVSYNDFTWNMSRWGTGGSYEGTFYNGFSSVANMMTFLRG